MFLWIILTILAGSVAVYQEMANERRQRNILRLALNEAQDVKQPLRIINPKPATSSEDTPSDDPMLSALSNVEAVVYDTTLPFASKLQMREIADCTVCRYFAFAPSMFSISAYITIQGVPQNIIIQAPPDGDHVTYMPNPLYSILSWFKGARPWNGRA